ncbi:MAG: leucyl aminopeptidase [Rhodocyclaceae bacterium]|jgi:leucyl aminopeptidase|nr:leucyl aminopeptidase [Rhodocyclaceae bacterium]
MKFSTKTGATQSLSTDALILGVFEKGTQPAVTAAADKAGKGVISRLQKQGDFTGKTGTTLVVRHPEGLKAERLVLVGLGDASEFNAKAWTQANRTAMAAVAGTTAADTINTLATLHVDSLSATARIRQAVVLAGETAYRFDQFKTTPKASPIKLKSVQILVEKTGKPVTDAIAQGDAIVAGMTLTRNLGNLPGNICTPTYLANEAKTLAKTFGLKCLILEKAAMEKLGMHSLLAVAKGSHQPPKFIVLEYMAGKKTDKPVVLVGKGITFDTGGISLKPAPEMDEMKYDMCGAASVLGTLRAVAGMKLPINLVVIVPTTENMPGGSATRPGDIVSSMSGQTIEILNTDAEGRLILCDALTYAERFKPAAVIDVATLTGACVIALGQVASGLLGNNEKLVDELRSAGTDTMDRAWQLPLWDDYQELLKSPFADMANIGGRWGGTITAACFLSRFTKAYAWAHLDIAGTAWIPGKDKGATGRPVPLLTRFLMARAGKAD